MATRSSIGVKLPNGHIKAIYCHWDGYPSGVGYTLKESYTTEEKINALIELGDLSVLGPEIGEKQNFNDPHPDWCLAYGRDRAESHLVARVFADIEEWMNGIDVSYYYLWDGTKWENVN